MRAISVGMMAGVLVLLGSSADAFLYRAPEGTLKDNCVIQHEGVYHLFTMYRYEMKGGEQDQWRNVWSATSKDGVHWEDVGPVIKDAPFGIYAMKVWKAGSRFVMDHGSFTGNNQDVLRFWESPDLVHWTYLGPAYDVRRPDGGRIDHMDVVTEEENGRTVYYGYAVGGFLRSEDGVKWNWVGELPLTDDLSVRVVQEPGGCQRIGDRYYLLVGGFFPGSFEYAVSTYIADQPGGPFKPDYPAVRLNGYSGRDLVALWAGYCRGGNDLLLSNYILDPGGAFWWHATMKSAVVDKAGHLRMGYWQGNDALKGEPLPFSMEGMRLAEALPRTELAVAPEKAVLTASPAPQIRWITPDAPNRAFGFAEPVLDMDGGCVIEGTLQVTARDGLVFPAAGLCLEQKDQAAVVILFETWGQTEIAMLRWSSGLDWATRDVTGYGCATVAGVRTNETASYRLLIRKGIFEIYLNDLLVQTFSAKDLTGRLGFIVQDGEGNFSLPRVWKMNLD